MQIRLSIPIFFVFISIQTALSNEAELLDLSPQPLSKIPVYQVQVDLENAPADFVQQCESRSIAITVDGSSARTEWTYNRKQAHKTARQFQRMGAFEAEVQVSGMEYKQLLQEHPNEAGEFAVLTDLMPKPESTAVDSASLLLQFQEKQKEDGSTPTDWIAVLEEDIDVLPFMENNQAASYLTGMYYYIQGQESKKQHDLSLLSFSYLPLSTPVIRNLNTGYLHMIKASELPGDLQEEAMYERCMMAYEIREHGDETFRARQGLHECDRYLERFPDGKHALRVSVHRMDFLRSMYLGQPIDEKSRYILYGLAADYIQQLSANPRLTGDPFVYEQVLSVLKPMEIMLEIGDNPSVIELYQTHYGQLEPEDFPASTYWMFAIIWNYARVAHEREGDFENALKFAELRLKPAPGEGNAWPQFGPVRGPVGIYKAAAGYARQLGDAEKAALYEQKAAELEQNS